MRNLAASEKLIEELLSLVDDGTITDEERTIVTQAIQSNDAGPEANVGLIEQLQAAMQANLLPGEERASDKTLVQTIVQQLQARSHSGATVRNSDSSQQPANSSDNLDDLAGKTFGNYRILQLIGRGGMGAVYEAMDELLHRHVALKIMLPEIAARIQNRSRFLREARAAASVEHDHICPIYQVGDDHGSPYIAMPLLAGETLESRIRLRRLEHLEIIDVIEQVAKGLSAAHQVGLIHRDVKPANVWLEKRKEGAERVRLLDFGLAQMETEEPGLTQPGSIMGTPSYMSPEQARGEAIDARTDLFSVGAMLYELLTGKKAFEGKTPTSVISSILVDQPAAPKSISASCPECLSDLTMRLLAKDPRDRLPSAEALSRELTSCRNLLCSVAVPYREGSEPARLLRNGAAPLAATAVMSAPAISVQSERNQTRWLWPLVLALALGGISFAGLFMFQTSAGTLMVETSDDAKLLFEKGELHVFDEAGKLAYRLSPKATTEKVEPGKYQVQVVGADGVSLSTNEFVMRRNEQTVLRVSAAPPKLDDKSKPETKSTTEPSPESALANNSLPAFRGKSIFATDFTDPKGWPFPPVDNSFTVSRIENDRLIYQQLAHNPAVPFLTVSLAPRLNRGACALRCKTQHGALFFNFCVRRTSTQIRSLSLGIADGSWNLYIQRFESEDKAWKQGKATLLASSTSSDLGLAKDDWLDVAFRWSEKDYGLWLRDEYVAGGTLPSDELTMGQPDTTQIGLRTRVDRLPRIEIDSIGLWDQSELSLEDAREYRGAQH